ncbi:hypothetical protein KR51_00033360 [Rubidibacter lacunae KORDI 51-2]|uniref:Thylakoid lumen protein n=1 Tax=Rubidibacter lacunae KORDI 51-2 TaxID=582515 RepID=U5DFJ9_9CHRO|nr:hypothetical protein [Rubidibacter lacunae]ERN40057.1 hypothetical protein KR51_00033360 [Rubidibacter lacunae KORDI 51-2]
MTNPTHRAFYIGRALAEMMFEQVERTVTEALSELGKFDAEQRERLRQFSADVLARADRVAGSTIAENDPMGSGTPMAANTPADTQAAIDDLRASIASARAELNAYKVQKSKG